MTKYNSDGKINVAVVDGTALTGFLSPEGYINVFEVDGTVVTGIYHPCGAANVFINDNDTYSGFYHPCGAWNVTTTDFNNGAIKVFEASGSFGSGSGPGGIGSPIGLLFLITRAV